MIKRSIPLIAPLSFGVALYQRAYATAGALSVVTWVALSSIKAEEERRTPLQKKGLTRSQSAPELTSGATLGEIRSIVPMREPILTPLPLLFLVEEPRLGAPCRPPIKVSDLPRVRKLLWGFYPSPQPATLVNGVVDSRGMPTEEGVDLDLEEYFKGAPLSLEMGGMLGAAKRIEGRKGGWVLFTNNEFWAHTTWEACDQELRKRVLIILGPASFRYRLFNRVDFRFIPFDSVKKELLSGHVMVRDEGKMRFIFNRAASSLQELVQWETPELAPTVYLPPHEKVKGDERYLIYRVRPGREA